MKLYRKVDNKGLFIEDVLLEEIPYILDKDLNKIYDNQYIEKPIPGEMYAVSGLTPKWNGENWIEVAEKPVVEESQEIPLEVRNRADIDYMSLMLGVEL